MKTSELIGPALNWAVAKCKGHPVAIHNTGAIYLIDTPWADKSRTKWIAAYDPSLSWAQGGPIIERERICTFHFSSDEQGIPCESGWGAFF